MVKEASIYLGQRESISLLDILSHFFPVGLAEQMEGGASHLASTRTGFKSKSEPPNYQSGLTSEDLSKANRPDLTIGVLFVFLVEK